MFLSSAENCPLQFHIWLVDFLTDIRKKPPKKFSEKSARCLKNKQLRFPRKMNSPKYVDTWNSKDFISPYTSTSDAKKVWTAGEIMEYRTEKNSLKPLKFEQWWISGAFLTSVIPSFEKNIELETVILVTYYVLVAAKAIRWNKQ